MTFRLLLLALVILLMGCVNKPKSGVSVGPSNTSSQSTEVKMQLKTMEDVQRSMDGLMVQKLGFRTAACHTPSDNAEYIKHCFVSSIEPEQLLKKISQEMGTYGEVSMGWRQDVGFWVSTYRLTGGVDADLLISLIAPGLSSSLQEDSKLKDEGTYAWYILGPHS